MRLPLLDIFLYSWVSIKQDWWINVPTSWFNATPCVHCEHHSCWSKNRRNVSWRQGWFLGQKAGVFTNKFTFIVWKGGGGVGAKRRHVSNYRSTLLPPGCSLNAGRFCKTNQKKTKCIKDMRKRTKRENENILDLPDWTAYLSSGCLLWDFWEVVPRNHPMIMIILSKFCSNPYSFFKCGPLSEWVSQW